EFMNKYILEIIVFICGASLMTLELVGSRVLAPYVGTSIIVWTSLIGIILGFLSLGYWWGGRIADNKPSERTLSFIIFLSSFFVFFIIIANSHILYFIRERIESVYVGAVLGTLTLFAIPSFLLGIVSPYAIRLKMKSLNSSGKTVGNLYAISTIGSIVGTFSAGFFLIPFLGTIKILYLITILLVLASLLVAVKHYFKIKAASILLFVICFSMPLSFNAAAETDDLIDIDTKYSRIWLYPSKAPDVPRPVLRLTTDPFSVQSAMFLDRDDDLVFKYTKYFRLADHFDPDIKKALMIGGAAYSYPKDFLKKHPESELTVVEIDPGMTKIAREYFNLSDDHRLRIVHQDGRAFLNKNKEKFDVIYMDAFTSKLSVPYQLTTREAMQRIYNSLQDDGVFIFNIASALEGKKSKFLQAEFKTCRSVFKQAYVLPVDTFKAEKVQNLILIAFKHDHEVDFSSDNSEYNGFLSRLWQKDIDTDLPILTDDYAPVDHYIKNLIN
ncbi:spermidine synthase, partial [Candidatus Falkowbacteria bacterium]|nr:spermidine synthase [Candidatus Falkowbacteria bacterium]